MTQHAHQLAFLEKFQCLGADCEDTCCKGWSMQLDAPHLEKYQSDKPELLDAVAEDATGHIMRRDPQTDYCVKFSDGLCGIHKDHGTDFLGDACHFYPRSTRALGEHQIRSAAISCPEVVRLSLLSDEPITYTGTQFDRLPHSLKNYAPEGIDGTQVMALLEQLLSFAQAPEHPPELVMASLHSVALSLKHIDVASWPSALPFYLRTVGDRPITPEPHPADPYRLLHALCGLILAAPQTDRPRLEQTIADMEIALKATLDWERGMIEAENPEALHYPEVHQFWRSGADAAHGPILKRWLAMQLSIMAFPFSGFGGDVAERAMLLGVRFATLRLALMCAAYNHQAERLPDEELVRIIQSLARFMDHLGDPTLSVSIYDEAGWSREGRLLGLLF